MRRPDLYITRNAVCIFDAAVFLLSEFEKMEQLDRAFYSGDPLRLDAEAQRYFEYNRAQSARINAALQDLKSMPWERIVEYSFASGSRLFADIIMMKGVSLGADAFIRTIAPKLDAFIKAAEL